MSTYGAATAPSQNTINYDAILSTSLFNYRKTLQDNISKSFLLFYMLQEKGYIESEDGGVAIQIPLMYALGNADWYSGYDVLNTDPTDGITSAFFDWRQLSVPISISRLEERQNAQAHRIIDLIKAKIQQSEIGIKEKFARALMQGAIISGGSGTAVDSSNINGASGIEPLPKLIAVTPTNTVGNISGNTSTWWKNVTKQAVITSSSKAIDFLLEADDVYNSCAKGPGGPPNLIVTDKVTFQVWRAAYYQAYRRTADTDNNYPFENFKFNRAVVTWDEFMPDVNADAAPATLTNGTAFFLNTEFIKVKYDAETNFVNTPFQKPVNQDAKIAHIMWMGNVCISNRRKLGVWYKLPTTLTWT